MREENINWLVNIERWLYIRRASYRRVMRLLFPSPAEIRFIRLMGGKVLELPIKNRKGFKLVMIISMGKFLGEERFKREVRCGAFFIDFGNDIYRAVEIDGQKWHMDKVREYERDMYLYNYGWRVLHIRAADLWRQPSLVQRQVLGHIYY